MKILETERTILREIIESDAEFIFDLLNQPSFIKYIGDRNVRTLQSAREFIENRYRKSYREHGFGLYVVELKTDFSILKSEIQNPKSKIRTPIGICGFVKRDSLPDADIGFALLPQFCGEGYAFESADAVMKYGREVLGLKRVLAITSQDNESSGRLLERIGFKYDRLIKLPHDDEKLKLFSSDI
ncbi:MAG: GNAT family N-acetyltransferase [Pyrinomonadaceae bacterium]